MMRQMLWIVGNIVCVGNAEELIGKIMGLSGAIHLILGFLNNQDPSIVHEALHIIMILSRVGKDDVFYSLLFQYDILQKINKVVKTS